MARFTSHAGTLQLLAKIVAADARGPRKAMRYQTWAQVQRWCALELLHHPDLEEAMADSPSSVPEELAAWRHKLADRKSMPLSTILHIFKGTWPELYYKMYPHLLDEVQDVTSLPLELRVVVLERRNTANGKRLKALERRLERIEANV